jgi:hypothetical protein
VSLTPRLAIEVVVVELPDLLAEKLWVYLQSANRGRADLRWSDLFDMVALIHGAPSLRCLPPASLRAACARYFGVRGGALPHRLPEPPPEWRRAWFRLVGPVTRRAPTLDAAWQAAADFWQPLLRSHVLSGMRWSPSTWCWQEPVPGHRPGPLVLLGDQR